jgi:hypothetical protein
MIDINVVYIQLTCNHQLKVSKLLKPLNKKDAVYVLTTEEPDNRDQETLQGYYGSKKLV